MTLIPGMRVRFRTCLEEHYGFIKGSVHTIVAVESKEGGGQWLGFKCDYEGAVVDAGAPNFCYTLGDEIELIRSSNLPTEEL